MGFNIIEASRNIGVKYKRYLRTLFNINDPDYQNIFNSKMNDLYSFENGPFIDVIDSFSKGRSVKKLIEDGILSREFEYLPYFYNIPSLYYHQEQAILKANNGKNLIVSTGTGSGKTESFLLPIIDELLKEKEDNTLSPGVRALIIYPMNALANDQIDRLRKIFKKYPDITFGCYTGQTPGDEKIAISNYKILNGKRIDDEDLRNPIPNEKLSRESMKANPPHILITNYAMLEFLMLRPEDNVFFSGKFSKFWKYIVLDEAHTYVGSTGIEVSMLIRRLLAMLNYKVQFILTSATLGDENTNDEVIKFANNLCSVEFEKENIIRATRDSLTQSESKYELDINFYNFVANLLDKGYEDSYAIKMIEEKYKFNLECTFLNEYLYEILIKDNTYWKIMKFLNMPRNVSEICDYLQMNEKNFSTFVDVASYASKRGSKLFDCRYHMFLKASEGVFITLAPHKELFLTRTKKITFNNEMYEVFEAVNCKQCHSIYLLGKIENDHLVQKSNIDSESTKEAFYLGNSISDTDSDYQLGDSKLAIDSYELCPHCGFIRSKKLVKKITCGHRDEDFVSVIKVKTTNERDGRVTKCIACESVNPVGILRGFFSGQEASTSVIGTALYEELPGYTIKTTLHGSDAEDDGFDIEPYETEEIIPKAKQFIAFSDNRQAAAYFSSYFSSTYDNYLYGKMMLNIINDCTDNYIEVPNFIKALSAEYEGKSIIPFADYLENLKNQNATSYDYESEAWMTFLKELVDNNQRNSLVGLGLLNLGLNRNIKISQHRKYDLSEEEVRNICLVFIMGMLSDNAIYCPKVLSNSEREFYSHNGVEQSYLFDTSDKYVKAFIPTKENLSNKRIDYLNKILKKDNYVVEKEDVIKLLKQFWIAFFEDTNQIPKIMIKDINTHKYRVNVNNLTIERNCKKFICSKCKRITSYNVKNVCPTYLCDGTLEEVNVNSLYTNNHYYRLYNDFENRTLRIVEHTAQLDRNEAYKYQNLFKDKKIDVLSCSTTFEMGVDVGSLETVFMRNMPPAASNYAQRAGRAGRSSQSAAFALTFCNRSNHDFNYFDRPLDMINGVIYPPLFKVENEKICIRHIYSAALGMFFKMPGNSKYFTNASKMMLVDNYGNSGYEDFYECINYNKDYRQKLKEYLKQFVPQKLHDIFELDSFGWLKWMFDYDNPDYPNFKKVYESYRDELETLENELVNQHQLLLTQKHTSFYEIKDRIETYRNEDVISFLSRNNILPKYGFPVDTVELRLPSKLNGIELSRDMSVAISEYAPGCEVVANNKIVTSRYIKKYPNKSWKRFNYVKCDNCNTLNVFFGDNRGKDNLKCKQCNTSFIDFNVKTFIIPEFGFVSELKTKRPSLIKPERTYRTEASFYCTDDKIVDEKYQIGDIDVLVAQISNNGEMVILNTSDFAICPTCGYTKEIKDFDNAFFKDFKYSHDDDKGYRCSNETLEKYSLGYKFKTDIIRIKLEMNLFESGLDLYNEAYSVLQALVLASCRILNIENTEIAGCLQYDLEHGGTYNYILYDKTPGGAGHVRRLCTKDKIDELFKCAYSIANECTNCSCDSSCYSCLRTYQNQKYHDLLKRSYVTRYLKRLFVKA